MEALRQGATGMACRGEEHDVTIMYVFFVVVGSTVSQPTLARHFLCLQCAGGATTYLPTCRLRRPPSDFLLIVCHPLSSFLSSHGYDYTKHVSLARGKRTNERTNENPPRPKTVGVSRPGNEWYWRMDKKYIFPLSIDPVCLNTRGLCEGIMS